MRKQGTDGRAKRVTTITWLFTVTAIAPGVFLGGKGPGVWT
jgi:hypothetical protein